MRQVEIQGCQVKKCLILGLLIAGLPTQAQRLQVKVTDCKFFFNKGDAAIRFENLRSYLTNRYENRLSNLVSQQSPTDDQKNLQAEPPMIRMVNCEVYMNKRNGVDFDNTVARFSVKNCVIRENKHSGIQID